jgi:integrase/recombinase XerC
MGAYRRGLWWHYKKQIEGITYVRALKIKRGMEDLLPERIRQVEKELIAKHYGLPYQKFETITMDKYLEKYIEQKRDKKSLDRDVQRLGIISEFLGDPPLDSINKSDIQKLERHLFDDRHLKAATVNRYFEVLRSFLNLASEDKHLTENPCKFYQRFIEDGQRRALSKEELKIILDAAKKIQEGSKATSIQSKIYDLILFGLNSAMRLSEILNLKKFYIRDDLILYPITETKYRRRSYQKNDKVKVICLNSIAQEILGRQKSKDEFIFPIKRRQPNTIRKVIARIRKTTGVKDFHFHQLRHTVSTMIASSAGLATAKLILGHSDISTTLKYTHPGIDEQRKGVTNLYTIISELVPK